MAIFIILTNDQANTIRVPLAEINPRYQPIERANSKWIIPKSILSSVNHADYHEFLSELPQLDYTDPLFPEPYESPE